MNNSEGFDNGGSGSNDDYAYDGNGNLIKDANRGITGINYNVLNLPGMISGRNVQYTYDGLGNKLKTDAPSGATRFYAGNFEYGANNALMRIGLEEGQLVSNSNGEYEVHYYLKDHLGNVRMVLKEDGTVLQETEYYPFGLAIQRSGNDAVNRYQYNGKEKQPETGYLDYGARMYMPEIGRWGVVDLKADKYYTLSPFAYVANNPFNFIDPDGKEIFLVLSRNDKGEPDLTLKYQDRQLYNLDGTIYKSSAMTGFSNSIRDALNKIRDSDFYLEKIISTLESTKTQHFIEFNKGISGSKVVSNESSIDPKSTVMMLNYSDFYEKLKSGESSNLETTMTHELSHQYDKETGKRIREVPARDKQTERDPNEIRAVNVENRYRYNNNMNLRKNYGGRISPDKLRDPKEKIDEMH